MSETIWLLFQSPLIVHGGCDYDSSVYNLITSLLPFFSIVFPSCSQCHFPFHSDWLYHCTRRFFSVNSELTFHWLFSSPTLPLHGALSYFLNFLSLQKLWMGRSRKPSPCFQAVSPAPQSGFLCLGPSRTMAQNFCFSLSLGQSSSHTCLLTST